MSSDLNRQDQRKMSSITRKIHGLWIRERIKRYISSDILLALFLYISFVISNAYFMHGDNFISYYSDFIDFSRIDMHDAATVSMLKELLIQGQMRTFASYLGAAMGVIASLQAVSILGSYSRENRKINKILSPINQIALKADELSRLSFNDDKYRILEDAISNIDPGAEEALHFNNMELQGVEAAMNNLIYRMRESYRQQARFVNDASHELRTPIAVIEGYANMLARWGKEDEKVLDESIAAIQNESSHMKHLVEQLLFLARGDSGKTELNYEYTSINDLMNEIYEESLMIDENHLYRYKPNDNDIKIMADAGLLKQAVRILIDNAAKYTAKNNEIILSTGYNAEGKAYLQVQDNGIGMEGSDIEHMFERFYRADEARNTEGTGLGLSIAKWIVDKHNGHFEITSVTEIGTRIQIVID